MSTETDGRTNFAFALADPADGSVWPGLTKLEYAAIAAMQGLLANPEKDLTPEVTAAKAYRCACHLMDQLGLD